MIYFIVSKSCLERAFVTLKRIIEHCVLVRLSGVRGVRGDEILRTNGEEFAAFQREMAECVVHPAPQVAHRAGYKRTGTLSENTVAELPTQRFIDLFLSEERRRKMMRVN